MKKNKKNINKINEEIKKSILLLSLLPLERTREKKPLAFSMKIHLKQFSLPFGVFWVAGETGILGQIQQ
jgi:hypothetical protein